METAEVASAEVLRRDDPSFAAAAELLHAELPDPRFRADRYLRWLYEDNPLGRGIWCDADEAGVRVAHYGLTPMTYRDRTGDRPCMFSLNACTRSTVHRRGWFRTLADDVYARAGEAGKLGIIGVTNARSTKPVVTVLGFRLLGPMPVTVVPRRGSGRGVESVAVDASLLDDARWAEVARGLDAHPAHAWTNRYTPSHLAWRLRSPDGAPYAVHVGEALVCVSTVDHLGPVPMAVILKLLPRDGRRGPLSPRQVIDAACAFHGARAAVYAGWNAHAPVRGLHPPRRLQPSPLNLVYRSTSPEAPNRTFALDTWEFLDMDAY
jgi:hypothetical protein